MTNSIAGRWLACVLLICASTAGAGTNSWTLTGPEGGPIHALATHPTDPDIAVISTNRGLARSTDSGNSWSIVKNDTLNVPSDIAFDPSSPNRVIATDGLIYLSEDTGQTFQIAQGPEALGNVYRIAFAPDGTLYATTHAGNAYKATSPLAVWTPLTITAWPANSRIDAIAVDRADSQIVYAGIESLGVYRSNDGGSSWAGPLTTGFTVPAFFFINQLAVDPADSTHVFAATSAGIFRSVNSGSNWTLVDGSPCSSIDFKPGASSQMIAMSGLGLVLESSDNGATWGPMGIELQSNGLPKARYAAGPVTRLLYASSFGMSISGELPHTHSNRNTGIGSAATVSRIVKANDGTVYVGMDADWGSLYRRGNPDYQYAGFYWSLLQAITGLRQTTGLSVSATNSNVIFFVNRGNELIRTTDGAQTWSPPHPQFTSGSASDYITDVQIAPDNPQVAYVTRTETGVWRTTNGGTTFTQLTNSPHYVAAVGVHPANSAMLYAAGGPDNGSGIYKSTDGGATWTEQLAPSAVSHLSYNSFVFHPTDANTVFALGFGGVQKTINGGGSWGLMNFGPLAGTNIAASALLFDPVLPSTMIVLNNGNAPGFSRSVDGGVTWVETSFDIPGRESILYSGVLSSGTLVAGTNANGIVEYTVAPDLSLSMADMPDVLPLGTTYQSPITVTNHGPHASSAAEINIFRPTWLTPGVLPECANAGQNFTCQVGVLQPGESLVLPLSFAVAGLVNGSQVSVSLDPHEADPDTSNNAINENVTAAELIDLDMTIAAVPAVIDLDGTTVVTAQFVNSGPSPATNARIDFILPALALESATPSAGTCSYGGAFSCNFGTLPSGGSASVVLRFHGNAIGTFPISAMVYASGPDSDNAFNAAQLDIVVRAVGDVAISLAESADPVNVDAPLQYIATVRNNGSGVGHTQLDMSITGAVVTGVSTSDGFCTTTTSPLNCALNPPPGGISTVTVSLATPIPGIATATAVANFVGTDTQPDNNLATIGTTIRRMGDIGVAVAASADPVTFGDVYSHTVTVTNAGPNAGPVVVVIPVSRASITSATSSAATCTNTGSAATCNIASLENGASAAITVNISATSAIGTATTTATATFQGFDPIADNDSASAETLIRLVGDIGVALTESMDPATSGVPFTYTATVSNNGPNSGTVQLLVPVTGAAITTAVATGGGACTTTAASVQCEFAQFSSGASATLTITVNAATAGTASATATATFVGTDPASGNNVASASTTVVAPPPPPSGGSSSGGGGGGGRFDWLALWLLGAIALRKGRFPASARR